MIRAKKIFKITLLVLLIGVVVVPIVSIQTNKYIYKSRVATYLMEEKDYNEEEIESIEGKWGFKLPPYYAIVVFKNEPYVEYIYFAHDNIVLQFSYKITDEGRSEGIQGEDLKNYEPCY